MKPVELDLSEGQSIELLKELHILTRDGRINQDSRRKLKQVYHLYQFIEPLLVEVMKQRGQVKLVDHGAGKSYLGFILHDLFFRTQQGNSHIYGVEARDDLVIKSRALAKRLDFAGMTFINQSVAAATTSREIPEQVDIVTALHACDTATDDAIHFGLQRRAQFIVLIPCCQAEVATVLRKHKADSLKKSIGELWRHPIHTREFGSHATNVLRCLQLEAHGYQLNVTELVGWEHSMKNELIIASHSEEHNHGKARRAANRLREILDTLSLAELEHRFFVPQSFH